MTDNRTRSTTTVALLVVGVFCALWLVRFVIGAYGAYRSWIGRRGADTEDRPG